MRLLVESVSGRLAVAGLLLPPRCCCSCCCTLLLPPLLPQSAEEHWNFWHKYLTKHCFHGTKCKRGGPPTCQMGHRFYTKGLISGGCRVVGTTLYSLMTASYGLITNSCSIMTTHYSPDWGAWVWRCSRPAWLQGLGFQGHFQVLLSQLRFQVLSSQLRCRVGEY